MNLLDLGQLDKNVKGMHSDLVPDFTEEEWKLVKGSSDLYVNFSISFFKSNMMFGSKAYFSRFSFGVNHYSTKYATGKVIESGTVSGFNFFGGGMETVTEKDGVPIGRRGHNGHPYTGECILCSTSFGREG